MSEEITRLIQVLLMRVQFFYLQRQKAFGFMLGDATLTYTRGAILAVEFLPMANLVPTFAAFDRPIDELKHKPVLATCGKKHQSTAVHMRLSTVMLD